MQSAQSIPQQQPGSSPVMDSAPALYDGYGQQLNVNSADSAEGNNTQDLGDV